jgi:hypothetical protein
VARGDQLRAEIAAAGFAHATVTGTSMLPTLRAGELVRLEGVGEVLPGHIVAFEHGGGLLVHRIVSVAPDHVVCRGDNRIADDGITQRAAIVGRAVEVFGSERRGGVRLRDDAGALRRADARLRARRLTGVGRHLIAELVLLVRQAARSGGAVAGAPETTDDLALPFSLSRRMTTDERVALVRGSLAGLDDGAPQVVRALAFTRAHHVARAGACVRRALHRAGIAAGSPGDGTLPGADGAAYYPVHLFLPGELAAELEAAGARVVGMELETGQGLAVWRATVTFGGGATRVGAAEASD